MAIKKHIWNPFRQISPGVKERECWACGLHHKQIRVLPRWEYPIPLNYYRTGQHADWERHMQVPKTCVDKFPLWQWEVNYGDTFGFTTER